MYTTIGDELPLLELRWYHQTILNNKQIKKKKSEKCKRVFLFACVLCRYIFIMWTMCPLNYQPFSSDLVVEYESNEWHHLSTWLYKCPMIAKLWNINHKPQTLKINRKKVNYNALNCTIFNLILNSLKTTCINTNIQK